MTEAVRAQLAAAGVNVKPERTSGRGTADKPAGAKKSTKKDPSDEPTRPQMQAARSQAVGYGRRADTNTTFGVPIWVRRYHVLSEAEARQLDEAFEAIVNHANL